MDYRQQIISARDGYPLAAHVFDIPRPGAVVLCIHGMEEHQGRYVPFASFLRDQGFAVVTSDLRGHGESAPVLSHIADHDGDRLLLGDEESILSWIKSQYPGAPTVLFGHSMGTIIARAFLKTHSGDFSRVILSGYPNPQSAAKSGASLVRVLAAVKGVKGHSKLIDKMVLGGFSKAVPNAETPLDWLSFDRENVRRYAADPLCGVPFTLGSYDALFRLIMAIDSSAGVQQVNPDLPILLISGREDPCTGGEKGRADSIDRLNRAGFRNLRVETIDGMRHEILNEKDHAMVFRLIADFLRELPGTAPAPC